MTAVASYWCQITVCRWQRLDAIRIPKILRMLMFANLGGSAKICQPASNNLLNNAGNIMRAEGWLRLFSKNAPVRIEPTYAEVDAPSISGSYTAIYHLSVVRCCRQPQLFVGVANLLLRKMGTMGDDSFVFGSPQVNNSKEIQNNWVHNDIYKSCRLFHERQRKRFYVPTNRSLVWFLRHTQNQTDVNSKCSSSSE